MWRGVGDFAMFLHVAACMILALMPFAAYKTFTIDLRRVRECTGTVAASVDADPRHGVAAANWVQKMMIWLHAHATMKPAMA